MRATIRYFAAAFTAGATIAMATQVVLQVLTASIRVTAPVGRPWWAGAVERSVWIALGLVMWLSAPLLGEWIDDLAPGARVTRRAAWGLVGVMMMTLPVGHLLATWIALAMQLSVTGTWASDGGILLSGAYYGTVLLSLTPWMAAGAILRAWARHMIDA